MRWYTRLTDDDFSRQRGLRIARKDGDDSDNSIAVLESMTFVSFPNYVVLPTMEPPIPDGIPFLQAMLNAAWEAGLRPDGYKDIAGQMQAIREHRDDMRTIAFNKLGIAVPPPPTKQR